MRFQIKDHCKELGEIKLNVLGTERVTVTYKISR